MSSVLKVVSSAAVVYLHFEADDGRFWDAGAEALVAFVDADWANYAVTGEKADAAPYHYIPTPAELPTGLYTVTAWETAALPAATDDDFLGGDQVDWDGTDVRAAASAMEDDIAAIKVRTDLLALDGSGRVTVGTLATGVVTAAAVAADAGAEIAGAVLEKVVPAATAAPAAPYTVGSILGWLLALGKFRRTQTATTQTLYQEDGATPAATASVSNDGSTTTRGEYA